MLPEEFLSRMRTDLSGDFPAFLAEYEKPPVRGFRVNTLKIGTEELLGLFPYSLGPVPWCADGFYYDVRAGRHLCSRAGLIYSQEPSAMIAAELLDPKPGERVLDLCAAPGGKSTQLAARLQGRGLLVSNEIVPSRAAVLTENLERMGAANAAVTNMSPEQMEGEFPLFFDKILVDAPCSGEGMFRRDPEAVAEWSPEHSRSCALRQLNILESAVKMLRGGGELVYSTCTFAREENEGVCEKLLSAHPELTLTAHERLMPHTCRGEGHFAAKLVKSGNERLDRKPHTEKADIKLYRQFESESLNLELHGDFAAFGERLYLLPEGFGTLKGIKSPRPGLYLGDSKKGRFEPAHHLCMALKNEDFRRTAGLSDEKAEEYCTGAALDIESEKGWIALTWRGFPIGWGKSSGDTIKNRLPKFLRG